MKRTVFPLLLTVATIAIGVLFALNPWRTQAELVLTPSRTTNDQLRLTLDGGESTNAYVVNFADLLTTNGSDYYPLVTGAVAQVVFDLNFPTNSAGFYRVEAAPNSPPEVATPVLTPGGGAYPTPTNVIVACATAGAAIYFTTNDSAPTTSDQFVPNGGSVVVACSLTLKARAFRTGFVASGIASADYQVNCAPNVYAGAQQVIGDDTTTLQGVVTDDGLPVSAPVTKTWSKVSGPGTVSFINSALTKTSVTFASEGIYVLQLVASDTQFSSTSRVTVAWNPTISVTLISPTNGFTCTVPTNFPLQAIADCSSGNVTQVTFYAGSSLIGMADFAPFDLDWRSVPAGTHQLTAVALTDDPANAGLASAPVTITVNWPTNVGQLNFTTTDLQIPVAGFPLAVNRVYDTRMRTNGSFGFNGRLDYEEARLDLAGSLADGWYGDQTLSTYCMEDSLQRIISVTLREGETYYFIPQFVFALNDQTCIFAAQRPTLYNDYEIRLVFVPLGKGQLEVATPSGSVGMDDGLSGWEQQLFPSFYDDCLFPTALYDPLPSEFTFTAPDGTQYQFNDDGTLAAKIDRNGNQLAFSPGGITYSHPNVSGSSKTITFARDSSSRITNVFDIVSPAPTGPAAFKYTYDSTGNLTNVARLVQRSPAVYENTSHRYTNASHPRHLTHIVDSRGVTVQHNLYDTAGRLSQQFDALTNVTSHSYDLPARRQTIVDRMGFPTTQAFADAGQVASILNPLGGVRGYAYDERGRLIRDTDESGHVTRFGYDDDDNVITVTNRLGHATTNTYNAFKQVLIAGVELCL